MLGDVGIECFKTCQVLRFICETFFFITAPVTSGPVAMWKLVHFSFELTDDFKSKFKLNLRREKCQRKMNDKDLRKEGCLENNKEFLDQWYHRKTKWYSRENNSMTFMMIWQDKISGQTTANYPHQTCLNWSKELLSYLPLITSWSERRIT